ncbi:MAG TPA: hypothetical protein PLO14_03985 [Accumulibacter sp.]|uniref:hypothetical protein n=1 Tax=Accumulibacter sp. TaxID=2053492 RepID=UPI0025F1A77F|nr:hypothetical protein [Accumulibacter sp.]MCM8598089.1 hypothetical protein [Accumulibacter sp.]MCM8662033.1 hypothetical protein [Accumulibacter sp.]HNC51390.1 hypothetical protein [Accumulibacter sp.]HNI74844.1 hypothetical protein [Accumulibacter sp.]
MRHIIWVFWPAFIAAGIAETLFFTMIDPAQLYLFGQQVQWSPMATYSTGFLLFWLVCVCSSLMTYAMMPDVAREALRKAANEREDLARPKRREPGGSSH